MTATPPFAVRDTVAAPSVEPGVRLHRVDLLNWGTFHATVWSLVPAGGNTLLTGQVGAGKSSVVDGLTALLAPPNKIVFNKAAGADAKERSLYTYSRGAFGKFLDPLTGEESKTYLRKITGLFSVVLAVFSLPGGGYVSAGMILTYGSTNSTRPNRLYLLAHKAVSIQDELIGHADLRTLRANLRRTGFMLWDENFTGYQKQLCRMLGTTSSALDLFAHTVSMKEVSNLTTFVRGHMLETESMAERIENMLTHYSDCTRAHDVVVDVRKQVAALEDVENFGTRLDSALARISALDAAERALPNRVNALRHELLVEAIATADEQLPGLERTIEHDREVRDTLKRRVNDLDFAINSAGGADLRMAERDVDGCRDHATAVSAADSAMRELARTAEIAEPASATDFPRFQEDARKVIDSCGGSQESLFTRHATLSTHRNELIRELDETDAALQQATTRRSNIPLKQSRLRDTLCEHLDLELTELAFVGELLQVRSDEHEWEPAIQRLVHSFAISLLVPDEHYKRVATWVNSKHLGMLLQYYPVTARQFAPQRPIAPSTVAGKLEVRPGTSFTGWLSDEISHRYTHECVARAEDLARTNRAVTLTGQIRDGRRHIKDDRSHINDRLSFVLGWDTAARVEVLRERKETLTEQIVTVTAQLKDAVAASRVLQLRSGAAQEILNRFPAHAGVDVAAATQALRRAEEHLKRLTDDPELQSLMTQRDQAKQQVGELEKSISAQDRAIGGVTSSRAAHQRQLDCLVVRAEELETPVSDALAAAVAATPGAPTELPDCDRWESQVRDQLRLDRQAADRTRERNSARLINAIKDYAHGWPVAVAEIDTSNVDSRTELITLRSRLMSDDLPAYEQKFRDLLQRNAINEIAAFHKALATAAERIKSRISIINAALAQIDYTPNTYIRIQVERTKEPAIGAFRADMKDITENSVLTENDDAYSEERFLKVRALLDRIGGREGHTNEDKRWTERVTDVRNWFTYGASERRRADDESVEYYSDSDGKSGGQKEKLAYTILAASLAYQYGLADNQTGAFRLVMIDEAFGRGSDSSARYGMNLFTSLGLQVLVVTPMGKVNVIEQFVGNVGWVEQHPEHKRSRLISMTIDQWHDTKRRASASATESRTVDAVPHAGDMSSRAG